MERRPPVAAATLIESGRVPGCGVISVSSWSATQPAASVISSTRATSTSETGVCAVAGRETRKVVIRTVASQTDRNRKAGVLNGMLHLRLLERRRRCKRRTVEFAAVPRDPAPYASCRAFSAVSLTLGSALRRQTVNPPSAYVAHRDPSPEDHGAPVLRRCEVT